jgi:hypothetical protein
MNRAQTIIEKLVTAENYSDMDTNPVPEDTDSEASNFTIPDGDSAPEWDGQEHSEPDGDEDGLGLGDGDGDEDDSALGAGERMAKLIAQAVEKSQGQVAADCLDTLMSELHYSDCNEFLRDNPGAIDSICGWLQDLPEDKQQELLDR